MDEVNKQDGLVVWHNERKGPQVTEIRLLSSE